MGAPTLLWRRGDRDDTAQPTSGRRPQWDSSGDQELREGPGSYALHHPGGDSLQGDGFPCNSLRTSSGVSAVTSEPGSAPPDALREGSPGATQRSPGSGRGGCEGEGIASEMAGWDRSARERRDDTCAGAGHIHRGRNPLRSSFPPAHFSRAALGEFAASPRAPSEPGTASEERGLVHRDAATVGPEDEASSGNFHRSQPSDDLIVWIRLPRLEAKLDPTPRDPPPQIGVPRAPLPWRHLHCRSRSLALAQGMAVSRVPSGRRN